MIDFEHQRVPVTEVRIAGILGDTNIELKFAPEGGSVRVMHGRNGSGKTSILEFIHQVLTDEAFNSRGLWPFAGEIEMGLGDGRTLLIAAATTLQPLHRLISLKLGDGTSSRETLAPRRKEATALLLAAWRLGTSVLLLSLGRTEPRGPVATELRDQLKAVRSEFDARFRRADGESSSDLPARMLAAAEVASEGNMSAISVELDRLRELERRLSTVGLLGAAQPIPNPESVPSDSLGMLVFLAYGRLEKLSIFEPFLSRLEFVLTRINEKLVGKTIFVDDAGYRVRLNSGLEHEIERLSSGEIQELVMLHSLIFRTEPGTLVLIDEPETSLHLTWQEQFLGDLEAAAKLGRFNALITTHSPFIAGDRVDLLVPLGGNTP